MDCDKHSDMNTPISLTDLYELHEWIHSHSQTTSGSESKRANKSDGHLGSCPVSNWRRKGPRRRITVGCG